MKDFFRNRWMLGFLIACVAATIVGIWILGYLTSANAITLGAVLLVIVAGAALTYVTIRLVGDPTGFGLVPVEEGYTPGRRLKVEPTDARPESTLDQALDQLDQMIGLGSVKEEVNKLLAGVEV
jgi:hypothetical protein